MNMKFSKTLGLLIAAVTLSMGAFSLPAHAVKNTGGEYNTMYAGQGAKGYDVVSYFTDSKAVMGSDKFVSEFGGVKWQFSSKEHRDLFAANPEKYAPQFGGFCSWGVSVGKLFDVDPVNGWNVVDGKLYLNFNSDINAVFAKDKAGYISKANANWSKLNK
jgi:YHS domain-containing protein